MKNIKLFTLKVVKEKNIKYEAGLTEKITSPEDVYKIATEGLKLHEKAEESLYLITLDTANQVTGLFEVSRGSLNASIVHPREVFKRAIIQNACSIILIHNHPSGNVEPSKEDIEITERLIEAGKLLNIPVLDHIIIGDGDYTSLRSKHEFMFN